MAFVGDDEWSSRWPWSLSFILHFLKSYFSRLFFFVAGITAGSGYVEPWMAVVIGFMASTASFFTIWLLRVKLGLDDVLDVSSLQGSPGIVGSMMVGVFADDVGLIHSGSFSQLLSQFCGDYLRNLSLDAHF